MGGSMNYTARLMKIRRRKAWRTDEFRRSMVNAAIKGGSLYWLYMAINEIARMDEEKRQRIK